VPSDAWRFRRPVRLPIRSAMIDAVVVLGAMMAAPGVPGPALRRRLEYGVTVFFNRNAGHLIVSGGIVGPPPAEAHAMREMALSRGVAPERIVVEDLARNTFENAVYAGRIIRERQWRRVIIVTDAFHLPRALYVFRRLGLDVAGEGVPRPAHIRRMSWTRARLEEYIRIVRSAGLFAMGAHKPLLAKVWGE
jgi:uncharacterized SAM-binding protein YcdF (DUF218 family)